MLQNVPLAAKVGFDTADNGPSKVRAPTPPAGHKNIYGRSSLPEQPEAARAAHAPPSCSPLRRFHQALDRIMIPFSVSLFSFAAMLRESPLIYMGKKAGIIPA